MSQTPQIGPNRTGIGNDPEAAVKMREGAERFPPSSTDEGAASSLRQLEDGQRSVGSIPEKGMDGSKAAPELAPLLDRLGARLAFERTGVRLYDALLQKHQLSGGFTGGPSPQDLDEIRSEELRHHQLVHTAIVELGGDPTAMTPSADVEATSGKGILDVISDPRTTLLQGLETVIIAELTDRESWDLLVELADEHGVEQWSERFRSALETEEEHLERVRGWVQAGQGLGRTRH